MSRPGPEAGATSDASPARDGLRLRQPGPTWGTTGQASRARDQVAAARSEPRHARPKAVAAVVIGARVDAFPGYPGRLPLRRPSRQSAGDPPSCGQQLRAPPG
jgi:hypothetical protein